jgi:hypothetical protein
MYKLLCFSKKYIPSGEDETYEIKSYHLLEPKKIFRAIPQILSEYLRFFVKLKNKKILVLLRRDIFIRVRENNENT